MYKIGENEMVLCPYNRSHVVSKLRIQKHIIKCKSRYPEVKLTTCFYNYTHRLRPEEVLSHYEICSHKIRMEEANYSENNQNVSGSSSSVNDNFGNESADGEKSFAIHDCKANSSRNSVTSNDPMSLGCNIKPETPIPKSQPLKTTGNDDDLKPLNLPKTTSKAFTNVKQQKEESPPSVPESEHFQSKESVRGKSFTINSPKPSTTNDRVLPNVNGKEKYNPKKGKTKFALKNASETGNSCNTSVISSLFDENNTLKSDDITFDDNDEVAFKTFDKNVRI